MNNKSIISLIAFFFLSMFYVAPASATPTKQSDCGPNEMFSFGSWGSASKCIKLASPTPPKKSYSREKKCVSRNIGASTWQSNSWKNRAEQDQLCASKNRKKTCGYVTMRRSDSIYAIPFDTSKARYSMCSWE
jgi:hypothetical protein